MNAPILAPAAMLVLWSMVVLLWVAGTRFPTLRSVGLSVSAAAAGTRYQEIESVMPASVNWKSHNYTHLMEQPTLFYAAVGILALSGEGSGINLTLAWAYVGIRVVHSLWQALINTLPVRLTLFFASSACLIGLAINGVRATLF
jgi:hypothetical protein